MEKTDSQPGTERTYVNHKQLTIYNLQTTLATLL